MITSILVQRFSWETSTKQILENSSIKKIVKEKAKKLIFHLVCYLLVLNSQARGRLRLIVLCVQKSCLFIVGVLYRLNRIRIRTSRKNRILINLQEKKKIRIRSSRKTVSELFLKKPDHNLTKFI